MDFMTNDVTECILCHILMSLFKCNVQIIALARVAHAQKVVAYVAKPPAVSSGVLFVAKVPFHAPLSPAFL